VHPINANLAVRPQSWPFRSPPIASTPLKATSRPWRLSILSVPEVDACACEFDCCDGKKKRRGVRFGWGHRSIPIIGTRSSASPPRYGEEGGRERRNIRRIDRPAGGFFDLAVRGNEARRYCVEQQRTWITWQVRSPAAMRHPLVAAAFSRGLPPPNIPPNTLDAIVGGDPTGGRKSGSGRASRDSWRHVTTGSKKGRVRSGRGGHLHRGDSMSR